MISLVHVHRCQPWLGTYVQISARAKDQSTAQNACAAAFKKIAAIHRLMSFHESQSDVSRLNREAFDRPVKVSSETWKVLAHARYMSKGSGGIFDITVATVLQKWGLLPSEEGDFLSSNANYRDIQLMPNRFVFFRKPLRIDLGGIAKGFAVDKAVEVLKKNGVKEGLVNAGGDLRVFGGREEIIHVRDPRRPGRLVPVAKIREGAFATSAAYYSTRFDERKRVNSIVHPKTKSPSAFDQTVSVLASSCMTADALTKVVGLMGENCNPILRHFKAKAIVLKSKRAGRSEAIRKEFVKPKNRLMFHV